MNIKIDCTTATLDLSIFKEQAQKASDLGISIFWELCFLTENSFLEDSTSFLAKGINADQFVQELWAPFKEISSGVSLFSGNKELSSYFLWTEQMDRHFEEISPKHPLSRLCFEADVIAQYLLRISSFFPEEVPLFYSCNLENLSKSARAFVLSKERFYPLILEEPESSLGVCLPLEGALSDECLDQIEQTLNSIQIPYKILSELYLTESWQGIDQLIVFSYYVSTQGLRKLKGFCATGGEVLFIGKPLGLPGEAEFS